MREIVPSNRHSENKEHHPKFHLVQLRSAESGWNNVGKLEIMFRRAWLIAVVPPNWIISCGLFSEILEVLELNFHFNTITSHSYLVHVPVLAVENILISCSIASETLLKCTEYVFGSGIGNWCTAHRMLINGMLLLMSVTS